MNYHVRISLKSQQSHGEAEVDMTEDELETRVLAPYRTEHPASSRVGPSRLVMSSASASAAASRSRSS